MKPSSIPCRSTGTAVRPVARKMLANSSQNPGVMAHRVSRVSSVAR